MNIKPIYWDILSRVDHGEKSTYLIEPKNIHDFFCESATFKRIPDYQRPYSWTESNRNDLMQDILKISESNSEKGSWFLGPIFQVLNPEDTSYSDLLDGQQRVTTIQIILREAMVYQFRHEGEDFSDCLSEFQSLQETLNDCKNCLIRRKQGTSFPLFKTESTIEKFFTSYILDFSNIKSNDDYKLNHKKWSDIFEKERVIGSKTAGKIEDAIKEVNVFFDKNLKTKSNKESLINIKSFLDTLLWKCWLIEIPLQHHDHSIQIFESINNRGKQLSLVDKLRFKTIVAASNSETRDDIRFKWKKIYSGLELLHDESFIKSEDDFFKVFFNSIKGDDFTKEEEFLHLFESTYLKSDSSIDLFLQEVLKLIEFFNYVIKSLDSKNDFIKLFNNSKTADKVKALFEVLKRCIKTSANSRVLVFSLIRNNIDFNSTNNIIVIGLWNIIRVVYHNEIYLTQKSNAIRIIYMGIVKNIHKDKTNLLNFLHEPIAEIELKTSMSLFKNSNNDEASFMIYIFTYLTNYNSLISGNSDQYKKSHLDHLMPVAWMKNWSNSVYSKDDVIMYLLSLPKEEYEKIDLSKLIAEIKDLEDFELKEYQTAPYRNSNSLLEFIGNKWVLHAGTNCDTGHNTFEYKKEKYQDDNWIKIPSNTSLSVGINYFNEFTYSSILRRSLFIVNSTLVNFRKEWDDV